MVIVCQSYKIKDQIYECVVVCNNNIKLELKCAISSTFYILYDINVKFFYYVMRISL